MNVKKLSCVRNTHHQVSTVKSPTVTGVIPLPNGLNGL